MRDFTLKVEVKLSASGANGGIQYRSRLMHPTHGGSITDPLGKPLPPNVTTVAEAVAAGLTAAPTPRGGGPAGGNAPGAANAPGAGRGPGGGAPGVPASATETAAPPNPQGILSLQLEGNGQIWYRNVYLKVQDKSLDSPPR